MRHSDPPDPIRVAGLLIERHGLRAAAVASGHADEARQCGDAASLDRWRQVQSAITEIRSTLRGAAQREAHHH